MKIKITKWALQIITLLSSIGMFLFMNKSNSGDYYQEHFIDDFFALSVFSVFLLLLDILQVERFVRNKCEVIVSLTSLWLSVSSVFHFLTNNEWSTMFIIISIINIVAFLLFFVAMSKHFKKKTSNEYGIIFQCVTLISMAISVIISLCFGYYYLSVVTTLSMLLLSSQICEIRQLNKEVACHDA